MTLNYTFTLKVAFGHMAFLHLSIVYSFLQWKVITYLIISMILITVINTASIYASFIFINPISSFRGNYFQKSNVHFNANIFIIDWTSILTRKFFSSIQLLFAQRILFIKPNSILKQTIILSNLTSVYAKNYFHQSSFHLRSEIWKIIKCAGYI